MYGLVNLAIRSLVIESAGESQWHAIRAAAGVSEDRFIAMESYDDSVTTNLVAAASEVLGVPAPELLEKFGEYWTRYTAEEGYGALLHAAGDTFEEFISNLDDLHARVGLQMPNLRPPSFALEGGQGRWTLHYYSERRGLAPMVVGLLRGLAARFDLAIETEHLESESSPGHDVFAIRAVVQHP